MSEAMAPRHRPPQAEFYQVADDLVTSTRREPTQSNAQRAAAKHFQKIANYEKEIARLRSKQAAESYQAEKEIVRENEYLGTSCNDLTRGAASAVALARHQAPNGFRNYLVNCRILAEDTPYLQQQFAQGEFTEQQILAILTPLQKVKAERRAEFDAIFRDNPEMFESQGPKQIGETVKRFTLDFASDEQCLQMKQQDSKRYVHLKRGKDCVLINGSLPVVSGTALQMYLQQESYRLKQLGDPRTRDQIKADLLCTYLLAGRPEKLPIQLHVGLIMTDKTLFLGDREPAYMEGYGYVPPQYARELIAGTPIANELSFAQMEAGQADEHLDRLETLPDLIRLYTAPGDKELVAMDSKARIFPEKLRRFVKIRDRHCRTPFCDGKITEIDHVLQHHLGGPTDVDNADGRCSSCNKAKESPGWIEIVALKGPHTMRVNPGSSMTYRSTAPPATGYAHQPFPQLICDSQWIRGVKRRLHTQQDSNSPGP